jgi:Uma2 family endonuclease
MENEVREPVPKYSLLSPKEYLEMERDVPEKHEYYQGEVFLMSGASTAHNIIAFNLNRLLAPFLHTRGCKLFGSDFRIHVPENNFYTYPDFSIVCGKPCTTSEERDNLTNPTLIIEIVSKSTRNHDRGMKFAFYRSILSLKEYLLVDSCQLRVEQFVKQDNNSWSFHEFKQLPGSLFISSIGLHINLQDIYDDVSLGE